MNKITFQFDRLLQPGRIGVVALKNRMIMAAMGVLGATEDGYVTQWQKDYYGERAGGGVGLVEVEYSIVEFPGGWPGPYRLRIDNDRYIPGLSELTAVIHGGGARAFIQLQHAGSRALSKFTGVQPVSSSPVPLLGEVPREMTVTDIAEAVAAYARAAERAEKAGFEGVEIVDSTALLGQFVSSLWNQRRDAYGGDIRGRGRIMVEVVEAMKALAGRDFAVVCRIYAEQVEPGGTKLPDAQILARMLQDAGADAIHVGANSPVVMGSPPGVWVHLAAAIKEVVRIPVIAVGNISPELGEKVLRDGKADFIAFGRSLIADPDLPRKVATGRLPDIRPCIGCEACHFRGWMVLKPVSCAVNAAVGEKESSIKPAATRRRVLVVGGGPAGMEAARVAALRGHDVVLFDREVKPGGQLLLAAVPPHKDEISRLIEYLVAQVQKLGVRVETGKECTAETVAGMKPDAVIIATGSAPAVPEIPGLDEAIAVQARAVLAGEAPTGARVIVIGGGMVGCETAEFLANQGRQVTILEALESLAGEMETSRRKLLLERLADSKVSTLTGVKYQGVKDGSVVIIDKEGVRRKLPGDTIVIATGSKPDNSLYETLKGKAIEVQIAGDCVAPRGIYEAIHEGFRAGHAV